MGWVDGPTVNGQTGFARLAVKGYDEDSRERVRTVTLVDGRRPWIGHGFFL
jgi:hypothetical protein